MGGLDPPPPPLVMQNHVVPLLPLLPPLVIKNYFLPYPPPYNITKNLLLTNPPLRFIRSSTKEWLFMLTMGLEMIEKQICHSY